MGALSKIIFYSMIILIAIFTFLIVLIILVAFSNASFGAISTNTAPVANLGEDQLLSCYLPIQFLSRVSITWEKTGVSGYVYQHTRGAAFLQNQNSQFRGRTELFPNELVRGNASLLLRNVKRTDEGEYTCSITSSTIAGRISIYLKAAAYTAPDLTFTDGTLTAEAKWWFPQPNVTWMAFEQEVLSGNTFYSQNPFGLYAVTSSLQDVNISETYLLRIENDLVTSVSTVTLTETDLVKISYFTFNVASSLLPSAHLSITISVLSIFYVT